MTHFIDDRKIANNYALILASMSLFASICVWSTIFLVPNWGNDYAFFFWAVMLISLFSLIYAVANRLLTGNRLANHIALVVAICTLFINVGGIAYSVYEALGQL